MDDKQMYEDAAADILREALQEAGYELAHAGHTDPAQAAKDLMEKILKEDE